LFNERVSVTEPHAWRIGRDGMPGPEWLRTCGRRRGRRCTRRPNSRCGRTRYRSRGTSQPPPPRKRRVSPFVLLFEPLPYSPLPPQSSAPSLIFSRLRSPFNALRADPTVRLCLESPAFTKSCSLKFVRESNKHLGDVRPKQMAPSANNKPWEVRHGLGDPTWVSNDSCACLMPACI